MCNSFSNFQPTKPLNMLKRVLKTLLVCASIFVVSDVFTQTVKFSGTVKETDNKTVVPFAKVLIKDSNMGAVTDVDGKFSITVDFQGAKEKVLIIRFTGFKEYTQVLTSSSATTLDIKLESEVMSLNEVVVSSSRMSERILEAPVSIQRLNAQQIMATSSGNFYEGLKNLRGVDMATSSAGFQAVNMRGFNTTAPVRVVQFVDGIDNQAPGLNFPVGNLVGANPLDLESIEVITGPASALYGPNAFQGVVNMISKNPFDHQGISAEVKTGTRNLMEANFRYAEAFGKKKNFGVKFTASYMQMKDWIADDSASNVYGDISANVNLSSIVSKLQYDQSLSQEDIDTWVALNNYIEFNPVVGQTGLNIKEVVAPGYLENQLANNDVRSFKTNLALHYRFDNKTELSYTGKFGLGTAVYQGANRYSIKDIMFQQHKLEYSGKNFLIKAYSTIEDAGKSYDAVFTGINVSKASIADNWVPTYLSTFFNTLSDLNNDYDNDANLNMVNTAMQAALVDANNSWYQPGTAAYDSVVSVITQNADLQRGSLFVDKSALYHLDGQYTFSKVKWVNLQVGANGRYYVPRSFGTIFSDTLVNAGDTLANGTADRNAAFVQLNQWEVGGYIQATKRLFDDKLIVNASARIDKNQNFLPQLSPRLSVGYTYKNNNFRIGAQSAFRTPTLQNQYIDLNLGPIRLLGNLNGFENLYTLNSVTAFNDSLEALNGNLNAIDPNLLKAQNYDKLRPEQVRTLEVGYRGMVKGKLMIDADFYVNQYSNFIADVRVVRPLNGAVAGEDSGFDAIVTKNYEVYQLPVNSSKVVNALGGGIAASYFLPKGYVATVNYTYAQLLTETLEEDLIPGFNTPPHKVNIGLSGKNVWKNLGFNTNFQWVHGYEWQSTFGTGYVPNYHVWDLQLNYPFEIKESKMVVRLGCSNMLNFQRREVFGGPRIGRMIYTSVGFNLDKPKVNVAP
jgi:iron complex outermembrane recepter protein